MLGMPWWDYWVPLVTLLAGRRAQVLESFYAFHESHPINYDKTHYIGFGQQFARLVRPLLSEAEWDLFALTDEPDEDDVRRIGGATIRLLKRHASPLTREGFLARPINEAGEQAFAEDRIDEAFERFRQALSISPDDGRALNNLAVLSWRLGDRDSARAFIEQAHRLVPADRNTLLNFIEIQSALDRPDIALGACQRYLAEWRDDAEIGEIEARLRQTIEAQVETRIEDLLCDL